MEVVAGHLSESMSGNGSNYDNDNDFRKHYDRLIEACAELPPARVAVAHPCEARSLRSALDAADSELIEPVLIGPRKRIEQAADELEVKLDDFEVINTKHSHDSAERAVQMARASEVDAVMKGSLHTEELLEAVIDARRGLRTERRISHVFAVATRNYPKPLFITDAAINIEPSLSEKVDIVQNAIDLCRSLGIRRPRVAILSAIETVNPKIPSTVDAAALCKMRDRGQITGGLLDGPLAFDNAISIEAARIKKIKSEVAGRADILLVPDLISGNVLVKQMTFLGGADAAGIVLGARVPVILSSRSDSLRSRLASCALAVLQLHREAQPLADDEQNENSEQD
ncbi:MAG: bifunctional enoyl-CoA hydratase/phosphate acetyltransferase [Wenzhouxiangellaceae bacterium]|nr:bifunctional enoyl-CoA hydratase/phosphate acetyltransferase [Wenzhouxiangellaceae bacterium]